ncbi:MAG: GTPase [Planctomycetota bacterium]
MFGDTIAAVASPPGASPRGVIRISGPGALAAVRALVVPAPPSRRGVFAGRVRVRQAEVPASCMVMPAPGSYTGEDVVELHLPGAPLLMHCVLAALEELGVRAPSPGEFSRRAFENGRLRLEQAEAVADLIAADDERARSAAVYALSGGLAAAVARVRSHLEDACAVLESGLDFVADETGAVEPSQWLGATVAAGDLLAQVLAQLPQPRPAGDLLLVGAANAGKSSLCNALAGREAVLVGERAGTTRDVVPVPMAGGVTLLDAPGDLEAPSEVDAAALHLRDRIGAGAGGVLALVDLTAPSAPAVPERLPVAALVGAKRDLAPGPDSLVRLQTLAERLGVPAASVFAVSSRTGDGIAALRAHLGECLALGAAAPGAARWRAALGEAADAVARARAAATGEADELAAADIALALRALADVHGSSSAEAVLDRIFARFCLGK